MLSLRAEAGDSQDVYYICRIIHRRQALRDLLACCLPVKAHEDHLRHKWWPRLNVALLMRIILANIMAYSQRVVKVGCRFQTAGCPVTMLSVQYRMHPDIRYFPSRHFYNNQLTDG